MGFVAEFFSMFSGAREGTVMDEAARHTLAERLQRQERERFAPLFEAGSEDVVEGDDGSVFGGSFFGGNFFADAFAGSDGAAAETGAVSGYRQPKRRLSVLCRAKKAAFSAACPLGECPRLAA